MSIAPPTDIVLDVAQAADPQRLQAATQKLNAISTSAGGAAVDFSTLLAAASGGGTAAASAAATSARPLPTTLVKTAPSTISPAGSPYRKFEAILLQQMIQEMLPKDDSLFGDAASADICRSMLAEQLATQLSKTGAFGIAKMVEKAQAAKQAAASAAAVAAAHAGPA